MLNYSGNVNEIAMKQQMSSYYVANSVMKLLCCICRLRIAQMPFQIGRCKFQIAYLVLHLQIQRMQYAVSNCNWICILHLLFQAKNLLKKQNVTCNCNFKLKKIAYKIASCIVFWNCSGICRCKIKYAIWICTCQSDT